MRTSTLSGILLAGIFGASCSGDIEGGGPGTGSVSSIPSDGTGNEAPPGSVVGNPTANPGGTDSTAGSAPPPSAVVPGTCVSGVPVTSQLPRMLNRVYDSAVRDLLGVTLVDGRKPSAFLLDDTEGDMTTTAWSGYLDAGTAVAAAVMAGADKTKFINCDPAAAGCLKETVETFGRKAFRRPLTATEVDGFMRLDNLEPKGKPAEVAEAILYAFLVSPSFIMLPELAEDKDAVFTSSFKLSPYEVATRLSLLIWGSVPDEELDMAANNGELETPAQLLAQAQRMVQVEEKTGPLLASFHRFYADIRSGSHWYGADHDATKYPAFSTKERFTPAITAEMDAFFADVAYHGSFKDLLLSNVAYVNAETAPIYGLKASDFGADLERVELDASERPGYLTRAGFLSSFSRFDSTSPILRGAYLSRTILGVSPGVPKDGVQNTTAPAGKYLTQREATDALTEPSDCAGCHHTTINPLGYLFEMFDAVGGVQTKDPLGGELDTTAEVMVDSELKTFSTPLEFLTAVAAGDSSKRRYAAQWIAYATGRNGNKDDQCMLQGLETKLAQDGYPILNVLADLSQAESVRLRSAED